MHVHIDSTIGLANRGQKVLMKKEGEMHGMGGQCDRQNIRLDFRAGEMNEYRQGQKARGRVKIGENVISRSKRRLSTV